jgi:SAM-dependent methyltransferase
MLKPIFNNYSQKSRRRRAETLRKHIRIEPQWRILDLGGGTGEHINRVFPNHKNIVICDISKEDLEIARSRFGYQTIELEDGKPLPFRDKEFDLVFSSSVIEHVTGNKDSVTKIQDTGEFKKNSWSHQRAFALEIMRIAKRYYVQTPYKYFIIESHSWLPFFIVLLSRRSQLRILSLVKRTTFWPKKTEPDWNLLVPRDMKELFPGAQIIVETQLGLTKSIMAINSLAS